MQFGPKLETACTTPVSEGMVVRTVTDNVLDARREVLEFLLTSHPLDCPICDKGGECPLQNLTMAHGPGKSRYLLDDKIHLAKHYPLGELIYLDRERCIQCARCTRFQSDIAGDPVIGFSQRGRRLEIVSYSEPGFDSVFSGNTTDICPVGALTTADFRFAARPWELKNGASICTQCPVGCNLTLNVRREAISSGKSVIKRVMPRQNEEVNEIWICDKGRFAYHFAESGDRLVTPLVRKNGELAAATWDEALDAVVSHLTAAGSNLVTLAGGSLANEDLFNLRQLTRGLGGKTVQYGHMAGGEWTARVGLGQGSNIGTMGAETVIVVVASDLYQEAPIWYLRVREAAARRGAKVIVLNARPTRLDEVAAHSVRYRYGEEAGAVQSLLPGQVEDSPAAQLIAAAENLVVFFGSDGVGLAGSRALAEVCAQLLITTNHVGKPNNGLVGVWPKANNQGAFDLGFEPADDLGDLLAQAGVVYVAAADPAGDDPALSDALETAGFVVVQELFLTETARLADVVLPVQSFIEREGTFTSGERRVQRFYPVVPPFKGARPDFAIAALIAQRLEIPAESRSPSLVMMRLAEAAAGGTDAAETGAIGDYVGLSYPKISAVHEQWPIVHREDMFYGGTSYENRQGLGVQLQPGVQSGRWQAADASFTAQQPADALRAETGQVILAPVTRLYDRGRTVTPSVLLHARLAGPEICLHPATAAGLNLAEHDTVTVSLSGISYPLAVRLDEALPEGVAVLPRSVGVPLFGPRVVTLERAAAEPASAD
jgi:NADH-quinone oxidoreductase subunit G